MLDSNQDVFVTYKAFQQNYLRKYDKLIIFLKFYLFDIWLYNIKFNNLTYDRTSYTNQLKKVHFKLNLRIYQRNNNKIICIHLIIYEGPTSYNYHNKTHIIKYLNNELKTEYYYLIYGNQFTIFLSENYLFSYFQITYFQNGSWM